MADSIDSSFLERLAREAHHMSPLLPTYIHLLVSAVFPIFIAAHASLTRPSSAAKKVKKTKKDSDESDLDDENEPVQKIENLSPTDAILFPLLAGATLASLYFILKWLQDPAWLNYILGLYFSQLGLFFAFKFLKDGFGLIRSFIFPTTYSLNGQIYRVDTKDRKFTSLDSSDADRRSPLPGRLSVLTLPTIANTKLWSLRSLLYTRKRLSISLQDIFKYTTSLSLLDLAALTTSISIVAWHTFISKPWPLTNFLGFSFCYGALQYTTPTTLSTGTLILCALFLYDIYFVFYTPMMVTVATKLDVPIKLLFPRPDGCVYPIGVADGSEAMKEYLLCKAKKKTMAMLGLGDIVVPGMVLGMALRFDLYLHYLRMQKRNTGQAEAGALGSRKGETDGEVVKVPFVNATGGWGERFWTSTSQPRSNLPNLNEQQQTSTESSTGSSSSTSVVLKTLRARSFRKPYFYATIVGYLSGLIATVLVMQVWGHAQPALLYLVPGVLGSFWGTAVVRGEVGLLWRYTEAEDDEEEKEKDKEKKKEGEGKQEVEEGGEATDANGDVAKGKKEQ